MVQLPCRICGLDQGEEQWDPPTYDTCHCCMTEFGVHDLSLEQVRTVRIDWLTKGAKWVCEERKPQNWQSIEDLTHQLKNIPFEWW